MAGYSGRFYGSAKPRRRRRIGMILALVIAVVVISRIYTLFGTNADPAGALAETGGRNQTLPAPSQVQYENKPKPSAVADTAYSANSLYVDPSGQSMNVKPDDIIETRDRLNAMLQVGSLEHGQASAIKQQLSALADKWLFGKTVYSQDRLCDSVLVKPGDMLSTIGKRYNVPYEILMEINDIKSPTQLQADDTIKVINGPFHARIHRSSFTLDLYLQETFVRTFPVGVGQPGMETPTGLWAVKPGGKLIKPSWRNPLTGKLYNAEDPDYPLGLRWIGLEGLEGSAKGRTGFAIHGTNDPAEIGAAKSQGCVRMYNDDVVLIYNLLVSGRSLVEIVD